MRRNLLLAILALTLAAPAMAEEIIHFTNGTSMPVRSHRIEGDMVHVDLGGNALMAFPKDLIERIETTDQVKLEPSNGKPGGGRMIASSKSDVGAGNRGSRLPEVQSYPAAEAAEAPGAVPGRAPYRGREVQNSVNWGAGRRAMKGAENVGGHQVIDPGSGGGVAPSKKRVGFELAGGVEPIPEPPPGDVPVVVEEDPPQDE